MAGRGKKLIRQPVDDLDFVRGFEIVRDRNQSECAEAQIGPGGGVTSRATEGAYEISAWIEVIKIELAEWDQQYPARTLNACARRRST